MCILTGSWKNVEIRFRSENIFSEKGQIVVNNPINSDDYNDRTVPNKIALSNIGMAPGERKKIIDQIQKNRNKKTAAKLKRQVD